MVKGGGPSAAAAHGISGSSTRRAGTNVKVVSCFECLAAKVIYNVRRVGKHGRVGIRLADATNDNKQTAGRSDVTTVTFGAAAAAGAFALLAGAGAAAESWTYPVEVWDPPFDMASPRSTVDYQPLDKAAQPWKICVSFPHMKDAYWLAVDYGVVAESKRLGVSMQLVEAGGYTELNTQISQIEDCVAAGAQAVVIGAISYDGLNNLVAEIRAKDIPVIDVINGISSPELSAKSLVSFGEMGAKAGEYLAKLHPAGSEPVQVAWFPGPPGAGWVEAGNTGFTDAIKGSAIEVVDTKYGDTGKEVQSKLVEDTLEAYPDIKYIVGTAVTAEAATSILRSRGLEEQIKVVSYYFTPGVDQGIRRGQILAAPTDSAVIQGRVAIDQAVRILEGQDYLKHVGPALYVIDESNIETFDQASSLAPADFRPTFSVN
jgi:protein TorT